MMKELGSTTTYVAQWMQRPGMCPETSTVRNDDFSTTGPRPVSHGNVLISMGTCWCM